MSDYKEYDLYYASLMGGWYIPDNVCDEVVEVYNNNESLWVSGKVGAAPIKDYEIKKSTELIIHPHNFKYIHNYLIHLGNLIEKYKAKYPFCDNTTTEWSLWGNIKIQHYKPGEGFKAWHAENGGFANHKMRHLVFMTYLNTSDAGTEFSNQKIITPCHKGLTLIWPTAWTHTHRGVISNSQEKTIITGWYDFHPDPQTNQNSNDLVGLDNNYRINNTKGLNE